MTLPELSSCLIPSAAAAAVSPIAQASTTSTTGAAMMRATSSVLPGNSVEPATRSAGIPCPSSRPIAPSTITQSAPIAPCMSERRTPSGPSTQESRLRHGRRLACARYAVSMKSAPTLNVWTVRPRAASAAVRPRLIDVFPEPEPRPPTTSRGIPTSSSMRCLRIALPTLPMWRVLHSRPRARRRAGLVPSTLAPGDGRGKFKVVTVAWVPFRGWPSAAGGATTGRRV